MVSRKPASGNRVFPSRVSVLTNKSAGDQQELGGGCIANDARCNAKKSRNSGRSVGQKRPQNFKGASNASLRNVALSAFFAAQTAASFWETGGTLRSTPFKFKCILSHTLHKFHSCPINRRVATSSFSNGRCPLSSTILTVNTMSTEETTRKTFADASSDVERPDSNDSDELEKLDYNGLPLVPQPSRFKDDPLVSIDDAHPYGDHGT